MPLEHEGVCVYHLITVPASDFHPRGIDVTRGFVLASESCTTAATRPVPPWSIFQGRGPLTGSWSDEVIPSGVDRIHCLILKTDKRRGRVFRHGHERATRISGTYIMRTSEGGTFLRFRWESEV